MKTARSEAAAAPIVRLAGGVDTGAALAEAADPSVLERARAFAEPLLVGERFDTGEDALAHADGVAAILAAIGAAPSMRAAAYLVYCAEYLARPEDVIAKAWGPGYASLVAHTHKLVQVQRSAREALGDAELDAGQQAARVERVRKMLLAFSRDLRVVLLRLASRLQTLRWYAASKQACPQALAHEAMQVFAPLANRLGIWQVKWEIEDLAFRFTQPAEYRRIAALLDEKRVEREQGVDAVRAELAAALQAAGLRCEVQGRPKHLYSIWKKMQGKQLDFHAVHDLRALRVIVDDVAACYAALGRAHELWTPLPEEFDDYIARPKANGYQSLHTVVRDARGRTIEIQIRTAAMHEHAESGVAAHWAYKEAGAKGYGGVSAAGGFEEQVAQARKAVLRQLLAWERELADPAAAAQGFFDDRIYVFTPQAAVVELPAGATAVDFAYALHTDLGHRCRGARVDGAMLPLQTPLASGQTVEVIAVREGGPSLDWLNAELGYLKSPRARAKVRAWFNARTQSETVARGRDAVEKLLQREGRTTVRHDELAARLGFRDAEALFEVVGKDELSLRHIEALLRPAEPAPDADELIARRLARAPTGEGVPQGGVLVVGVESLLTTLARCCRPVPPDAIDGYVTRGKGVAVHRRDCSNLRHMRERAPERVVPVTWGRTAGDTARYPVDLLLEATDRPGLLRDLTEVLAKERVDVSGVHTQHGRGAAATQSMTLTVELDRSERLARVLAQLARVPGVLRARRR
ncbi:MAG TPA: bifunctional (p)ppGpp synthetase/guanosine-3',5'-bis(diphosphate) 3'-pyrophosphohydrolase [Methylibium sp.]|nr:bifunctional (p)ppGpp synthetase/guanosine-3',5'-bis(diphosphate) 3'-pyrophosphohydrolase [Methylibium sp.]